MKLLRPHSSSNCLKQDNTISRIFTNGMIDLTVRFNGRVYIIEFKVVELTAKGNALSQIKARKYHEKYSENDVYLIGIEFSSEDRNIVNFEWERILPEGQKKL